VDETKKYMTRFIAPVVTILIALFMFGGGYYLYTDIEKSALIIKEARDQIAAISARDTFARNAAQFLAETSAERSAVQFFVIPQDGTAQAIELVEASAKLAGVKAIVGSATISPQGAHHERLDISVSAEGTFAGQARFGTVLESLPRGASVKTVTLHATEKGWYGTYTLSFVKQK
jgi:hypothetical protein